MSVALTMAGVHINAPTHISLTSVLVLMTWSWELMARTVPVSMAHHLQCMINGTLMSYVYGHRDHFFDAACTLV